MVIVPPGQLAGEANEPLATVRPDGNVSVKLTPVKDANASLFGLRSTNVKLVVSFNLMAAAPKDFVTFGPATMTMGALVSTRAVFEAPEDARFV